MRATASAGSPRVEAVQFAGFRQRGDDGPMPAARSEPAKSTFFLFPAKGLMDRSTV